MTRLSHQQSIYIRKNTSSGKRKWIKIGTLTSKGCDLDISDDEIWALIQSNDYVYGHIKDIYKKFGLRDN
jgi:hypothetical protein